MSKVKTGKLMAGAVLAGIVMNLIDYVSNNFILATDWDRVARIHDLDMAAMSSLSALVLYVIVDMLFGFLVVWTYVAIRPRLGGGMGTATIAAFMVFAAEGLLLATYTTSFFSWDVYIRAAVLMLVATIAGGLSGAWVYGNEEDNIL